MLDGSGCLLDAKAKIYNTTTHRSGITQLPHIIHTSSQCHPHEPTKVPKHIQTQWNHTMQKSTHTTLEYQYQARYSTPV